MTIVRYFPLQCTSVMIFIVSLLASSAILANDFSDTRITFVFSDDNLLADPGETLINSPEADFGLREGNFFPFENLDTRDSGQETQSQLVLYRGIPGFNDRLLTEAALVLRASVFGNGDVSLVDDGSYIRLSYGYDDQFSYHQEGLPTRNIEVTLFPFNSERFRLGYQYDLSWGDQGIFTELNDQPVPAFKLQFNDRWGYSFIGAKSTRQLAAEEDPEATGNNEISAFYGGLAGLGLSLVDHFMLELDGGIFQSGTNRKQDVLGEPVTSGGGSIRISLFNGIEPGTSTDFRLYDTQPESINGYLRQPPTGVDSFSWILSLETSYLVQSLGNPDISGATVLQPAMAGAVNFDIAFGHWDLQWDLVYRDLAFILFNVPSLDPLNAFPESSEQDPELMGAFSAQVYLPRAHLTPGILLGMQLPAAYRGLTPELPNPSEIDVGEQTVVVRNAQNIEPLPTGEAVLPVYSTKLSLRWDISDMISILTQLQYSRDPNQTQLVENEFGYATRVFREADILGFSILTQARF